jgi:hypothetical protein
MFSRTTKKPKPAVESFGGSEMGRYYFGLQGGQNTNDSGGIAFETDLEAFEAAKRLAAELATARPNLRGNTYVILTRKDAEDIYCIGV